MRRMASRGSLMFGLVGVAAAASWVTVASAETAQRRGGPPPEPTRGDILRGEYGRYRANNDLLYYHLDIRVDPAAKRVSGKNTIRFRMLQDDTRIQIDLYANLNVDRILMAETPLKYERELNAVFIDFPETLRAGQEYAIDFHYSGTPEQSGRFGGFVFQTTETGRTWIYTACEGQGSSIWWPSKDQWRDEPDSMDISVAVPGGLTNVSNGRFQGRTDLGDGFSRWDYRVHYPINSYNVSINVTDYVHFSDTLGELSLDFYVTPENLDKARVQFAQAKPMMEAFVKYFGEYPFAKDGYKLIEVPYSGMEHQSAVTYGNRFANGYLERDWTGVGVSLKFDFIIIHESGHEWFGNAVSAADVSDMWIQEGWTTYLEGMYVEALFGYDDALKYVNGYKARVQNRAPIITPRGIHRTPPQDMYFKGALFLHTLRSVVNDDARWWALVRDVYDRFKYQNIMTEDLVAFMNARTGMDLTPIFDQYLRHTALPVLELRFNEPAGTVDYRWRADVAGFAMPVRVGSPDDWQLIRPTTEWQTMRTTARAGGFRGRDGPLLHRGRQDSPVIDSFDSSAVSGHLDEPWSAREAPLKHDRHLEWHLVGADDRRLVALGLLEGRDIGTSISGNGPRARVVAENGDAHRVGVLLGVEIELARSQAAWKRAEHRHGGLAASDLEVSDRRDTNERFVVGNRAFRARTAEAVREIDVHDAAGVETSQHEVFRAGVEGRFVAAASAVDVRSEPVARDRVAWRDRVA